MSTQGREQPKMPVNKDKNDEYRVEKLEKEVAYGVALRGITNRIHSAGNVTEILVDLKDDILTASFEGVINTYVGDFPVVVHTDSASRASHIYLRTLDDGSTLTFSGDASSLVDQDTGSQWDTVLGLALGGPLQGTSLRSVPYTSSYGWAWVDFYPQTLVYMG